MTWCYLDERRQRNSRHISILCSFIHWPTLISLFFHRCSLYSCGSMRWNRWGCFPVWQLIPRSQCLLFRFQGSLLVCVSNASALGVFRLPVYDKHPACAYEHLLSQSNKIWQNFMLYKHNYAMEPSIMETIGVLKTDICLVTLIQGLIIQWYIHTYIHTYILYILDWSLWIFVHKLFPSLCTIGYHVLSTLHKGYTKRKDVSELCHDFGCHTLALHILILRKCVAFKQHVVSHSNRNFAKKHFQVQNHNLSSLWKKYCFSLLPWMACYQILYYIPN